MRTFNTEGDKELGPLDEKNATSGDICCPTIVLDLLNFTTGFLPHSPLHIRLALLITKNGL